MVDSMPIQIDFRKRRQRGLCPDFVPMQLLDEETAKRNHGGQSLARLAERGGISPDEALALMDKRPWKPMDFQSAVNELVNRMLNWKEVPHD